MRQKKGDLLTVSRDDAKKVLMFMPHHAAGGGVVNFAQVLSRHLSSRFEVDHFTIGNRPGFWGKVLRGLVPLYDAARLAWLLSTTFHDIYHLNPSFNARSNLRDGVLLIVLRIFRRRNILVFIHGWDDAHFAQLVRSSFGTFLYSRVYRQASRILVLATPFAKCLETIDLNSEKIGITTTMFEGAQFANITRSRNDDSFWILFLARFVIEKGLFELLEAFREISTSNLAAQLILAGDGPEKTRAKDWCGRHNLTDRVRFVGYVSGSEKAQLFLDSDMFVLPSFHGEGCPIALLEAMGAGLPVIVTPIGGIPDIVKDGVNGVVLESHESSQILLALLHLIGDSPTREAMGQQNRQDAWKNYEANKIARAIEKEYFAIICK